MGGDTNLRASGGSLQPARLRCRSVPARLRKGCSAAGAARDFLGWWSRRNGLPAREWLPTVAPSSSRARLPYVREKTFLEASRCVRPAQQPRDRAAKSCGRRCGLPLVSPESPRAPTVYPRASATQPY